MKKIFFFIILLFVINRVQSQNEDYVWFMGNDCIDFKNSPPTQYYIKEKTTGANNCCISDKNGNLLFFVIRNTVYDANGIEVYSNYFTVSKTQSLIPYPGHSDKTLFFFFSGKARKTQCIAIDNKTNEISEVKTFDIMFTKFNFVSHNNGEDIWLLFSEDDKTYTTLITKNGFQEIKTTDKQYNFTNTTISNSCKWIIFGEAPNQIISFNNANGELGEIQLEIETMYNCIITENDKYIYYVSKDDYSIIRIKFDGKTNNIPEKIYETYEGVETDKENKSAPQIKLGPDGNIYILHNKKISVINNPESDSPTISKDIMTTSCSYLPKTFRYSQGIKIENNCGKVKFNYTNTANVKSLLWNFGDGKTSNLISPTYEYTSSGKYEIKLIVTDNNGVEQTLKQEVLINKPQLPTIVPE